MTLAGAKPGSRLDSLTGLRWFAALAVFISHAARITDAGTRHPVRFLTEPGYVGVSFFFILSGFVLTWSRRPGDTAGAFYRRRFARIYPVYLVTWVAAGALVILAVIPRSSTAGSAFGAVLLQAWMPKQSYYYALNGVAWSLSAEAFFYATFPLYVGKIARASRRTRRTIAVGAALMILVVAALANGHIPASQLDGSTTAGFWLWLVYICPAVRVLEFLLGVLLALEVRDGLRLPGVGGWAALSLLGFLAAGIWPSAYSRTCFTLVPFVGLIVAAASRDLAGSGSFVSRRNVVRLGEWSFSFYMVHQLVTHLVQYHHPVHGWLVLPTAAVLLVLSVAAAWLLFRSVEKPMDRRLRGAAPPPVTLATV